MWDLSWHLLCSLAFGLLLFLFAFFRLLAAICRFIICIGRSRYVRLFLTVPVQILLGLSIVVILKEKTAHNQNNINSPGWQKGDSYMVAVCYLHVNLGHSRDQFEGHNSSQRTHHTDRWKYQEHLSIMITQSTSTGVKIRDTINLRYVLLSEVRLWTDQLKKN